MDGTSGADWKISLEELLKVYGYYRRGHHPDRNAPDGFADGQGKSSQAAAESQDPVQIPTAPEDGNTG